MAAVAVCPPSVQPHLVQHQASRTAQLIHISGLGGSICTLVAQPDWRVRNVKAAVEATTKVSVGLQRLLTGVTELQDTESLPKSEHGGPLELTLIRRLPEQAEWLEAVQTCWAAYLTAPGEMRADYEVTFAAVQQQGTLLRYASESLRGQRQVVVAAVTNEGEALRHASEALRGDRGVILKAVASDGRALQYAATWASGDVEIASAAVKQNGLALELVAEALRADGDLVLAAVRGNGLALHFASEALRADKDVVQAAARQTRRALVFAAPEVRQSLKASGGK